VAIAAGILGGGISAASHATKAGSRAVINTSPEPFSNWTASIAEDVAVIGGLWTALHHPWLFLGLLTVFLLFLVWFLPRLWRGIKLVWAKVVGWRARKSGSESDAAVQADATADSERSNEPISS